MKGTKAFEDAIKAYLDKRAEVDILFAKAYTKEGKSIETCCTYIFQEVQKSGKAGFVDEEIYNMAVHYYDEDNIEIAERVKASTVVVNHVVELTDADRAEARKKAIELETERQRAKLTIKPSKKKSATKTIQEQSLF